MNSPTSTSQKLNSKAQRVALAKEGKWPPVGHPWRELALLPPEELERFFHGPIWEALALGLCRNRDKGLRTAVARGVEPCDRDEARGVVQSMEDILELPKAIASVIEILKLATETK